MADDSAISYLAAVPGTPVLSSTGMQIGTLEHVLQIPELDVFDGLVIATGAGLRFIDADAVLEITRSHIRCGLDDAQASQLPLPKGRRCTGLTRWKTPGRASTTYSAAC